MTFFQGDCEKLSPHLPGIADPLVILTGLDFPEEQK
jgi:hypothetical protein